MNPILSPQIAAAYNQAETMLRIQAKQLARCTTLSELVGAMAPDVPSYLRQMMRGSAGSKGLERAAEEHAAKLFAAHLAELEKLPLDQRYARVVVLARRDWEHLRGNFPRVSQKATQAREFITAEYRKAYLSA